VVSRSSREVANSNMEAGDALRLEDHERSAAPVLSLSSGYLQHINHPQLVETASQVGALISIPFRPGQFVLEGEALAYVSPATLANDLVSTIRSNINLGRHRTLDQDIEFGIAQIVEIAIRALSPAINDTFTGIACVDLLGEALTFLASASGSDGRFHDAKKSLRLHVRPLLLSGLVKQAFDQVRQAAADNPAVSIRILSTIQRLGAKMQHGDEREALRQQAAAVWETANSKSPITADRNDLENAWLSAQKALSEPVPQTSSARFPASGVDR
jgi:uncharacterized membrane protein